MPNPYKVELIRELGRRFGKVVHLPGSQSLLSIGDDAARVYVRYSKGHERGRTFYGLRAADLQQLEGGNSYIAFLSDTATPVFLPFSDYEEVFRGASPAADGQYKVQIINTHDERELYVARQGRFNVEGYVGLDVLDRGISVPRTEPLAEFSHSQVQTLLADIGNRKGYDVWIPASDIGRLDWSITEKFALRPRIPAGYEGVAHILCEVDVLWVVRGRDTISNLFEVEHSTLIYSGLLRFNDLLLTNPKLSRFSIVSNDSRRGLFLVSYSDLPSREAASRS